MLLLLADGNAEHEILQSITVVVSPEQDFDAEDVLVVLELLEVLEEAWVELVNLLVFDSPWVSGLDFCVEAVDLLAVGSLWLPG